MTPLVSIIVPVYKAEDYLPKCIESCLAQDYPAIELLLIEDGSPDRCGAICDSYAAKDSRIRVIHKENGGVSHTRNTGIREARGEFIIFVDADDTANTDMVSSLLNRQSESDADLVIAGCTITRNHQAPTDNTPAEALLASREDICNHLAQAEHILFYRPPWSKLYRRSIICDNNLQFDTNLKINEDFKFVMAYLKHCKTVSFTNRALYNYNLMITEAKNQHYSFEDITLQWQLNLQQVEIYQDFFCSCDAYDSHMTSVNAYMVARIRSFLSAAVLARGDKKTILSLLRSISSHAEYDNLCKLQAAHMSDSINKLVLFCCKRRAWRTMYFLFQCKNAVYSKHVYKTIE